MWEADSNKSNCRICNSAFGTFLRRHHCRLCGGIFCESCTATNVRVGDEEHERVCAGCLKGEVPGGRIRGAVESKISAYVKPPAEYVFTLRGLPLEYGSFFEKTNSVVRGGSNSPTPKSPSSGRSVTAPTSGYFEILNKTSSFCGLKVMVGGQRMDYDTMWEIPRASYTALPPLEILSGDFGDAEYLEVFVIYGNPNPVPEDTRGLNFQTGSMKKVAPCAAIENFAVAAVYRIECAGHNVFLKFKGDGVIEPRAGTSFERNGLSGLLFGAKKEEGKLDFETNVAPSSIFRFV